eukprot:2767499-Rhodomonas_salina.1
MRESTLHSYAHSRWDSVKTRRDDVGKTKTGRDSEDGREGRNGEESGRRRKRGKRGRKEEGREGGSER